MLDRAESVFEPLPNADDTDLGNTMRFVRLFKDQVRYNASTGNWYIWDGVKWQLDEVNCIMDLTKEVITDIRFQALATEGEEQTTLLRWAKNSESLRSRNAIVSGATSEPKLVVRAHDFDTNPHLLVVRNGTLDLETSTLRASRPEDLCSNQCTVDFDIMAECPKWLGHIEFITQGDKELARYMQIAMGYSLTGYGSSHERAFFFLEGDGANGKNVFIEPIMEILGSYAMVSDGSLLTGDEKSHPAIFADLYGKRFVFVDETRAGRRLNAERVKALVGSKRIKGRYMHKDWFEFEGRFKLWIAGNGRPTMQDTSDGIWTRLHEVPMLGKVGRDVAPVKDYGSVLYREEASGILNWMLEGFRMWTEFGLVKPAIVQRTTDEHRDDEDLEGQFIDECLEVTGSLDDRLMSDAIFNAWFVWAIQSGVSKYQIGTKADFIRRIRGRITKLTGIEQNSKNAVMRDPVTKKPGRGLIGVRFSPYVTFQQ
jgi:putative DNA primase/helicase